MLEQSIYDLDDDDIEVGGEQLPTQPEPTPEPLQLQDPDEGFMLDLLRSKGISDPSKIKFENESGQIEERSWNDLSREEQINIINTPLQEVEQDNSNDNELDNEEINLISQIRESGLTPTQYLEQLRNQVTEPVYNIDLFGDDELYLLDLESRIGRELTEDEGAAVLSQAKQNEELFKQLVEGIRKEYKLKEDFEKWQTEAEEQQLRDQAFQAFSNEVLNAIDDFSLDSIDLTLHDSDKDDIARFILGQDDSGNNFISEAVQDPGTLVKMTWFLLNGDKAFQEIQDQFAKLIESVSNQQYKKGFEDGKKGSVATPTSKLFIDNSKKKTSPNSNIKANIDYLDDDED